MKRLIKKILREEINKSDRHYRILDKISEYVELPYFKSMEGLTIYDEDDQEYIMKKILGDDIYFYEDQLYIMRKILGDDIRIEGREIFYYGNRIYKEDSDGYWVKWGYDGNGNMIYQENIIGQWIKWEYDDNGNNIYYEDSNGRWEKFEYDNRGYEIDSDEGWIR